MDAVAAVALDHTVVHGQLRHGIRPRWHQHDAMLVAVRNRHCVQRCLAIVMQKEAAIGVIGVCPPVAAIPQHRVGQHQSPCVPHFHCPPVSPCRSGCITITVRVAPYAVILQRGQHHRIVRCTLTA